VFVVLQLLLTGEQNMIVAGVCIALLGIPHGALDLHMITGRAQRTIELGIYLFSIALVIAGWMIAPTIMLGFFLLNSAWHFGDCDLQMTSRWKAPLAMVYGLAMLVVLIDPADPSVSWIIAQLTSTSIEVVQEFSSRSVRLLAGAIILFVPFAQARSTWVQSLLRSSCIVVVAALTSSLIAFTFYFAMIHAFTSMNALRYYMQTDTPWTWTQVVKAAAPLTLVSLVGIGAGGFFIPSMSLLSLLFIALSALTLPHSRLFHRVYVGRA
jgi:Brp/Blh family beta-carotene 15,15'-monooxygenase